MRIENEGATCDTCAHKGGKSMKQCRKCYNRDGRPGWDPAPGVQTKIAHAYEYSTNREYLIRQVVEA